ncbi:FABP family protein [Phytoactinopolyspora limicola]|uniref:FABP family protein n=1 Tax=Phytoactinopolyspora limicola TaxID=2715536 RepID=UPI00140C2F37|nr:FABP family protein [Phytoactinopolyspora limicola]
MIEVPDDLHPDCVPIAWLLGRWEGAGIGDYPTIEAFRFGQEVEFTYVPGRPFLSYTSRSWILDDDGNLVRPAARETGYWRPQADQELEVLLTHPTGFVEVYLGRIEPARVELATRGVLKTETAKDYRSGHRLYGLVDGSLMYVYEMSAMGQDLQPHLSAELKRVTGGSQAAD